MPLLYGEGEPEDAESLAVYGLSCHQVLWDALHETGYAGLYVCRGKGGCQGNLLCQFIGLAHAAPDWGGIVQAGLVLVDRIGTIAYGVIHMIPPLCENVTKYVKRPSVLTK